jgi:hypothetical protein
VLVITCIKGWDVANSFFVKQFKGLYWSGTIFSITLIYMGLVVSISEFSYDPDNIQLLFLHLLNIVVVIYFPFLVFKVLKSNTSSQFLKSDILREKYEQILYEDVPLIRSRPYSKYFFVLVLLHRCVLIFIPTFVTSAVSI